MVWLQPVKGKHMKKPYLQCEGDHWQKQRTRTLVRDDFTCQFEALNLLPSEGCSCDKPETRLRFLQRQNGGTHDLDNLVTICRVHHAMIHPHMRYELAQGERKVLGQWIPKEL